MADSMGRRLAGRYEVRSLIGRGGMAEVHLGFDTRLSRVVAIKMLRSDLARDSVFQARSAVGCFFEPREYCGRVRHGRGNADRP